MASMTVPNNAWSLCLWREARGEGYEGMRAVAWVIENRSKAWKQPVLAVILAPNQFTSMSESKKAPDGTWQFEFPPEDDAQWDDARKIVGDIVDGTDSVDPTHGALYYANLKTATSGWFFANIVHNPAQHPQTVAIGHQTFYE